MPFGPNFVSGFWNKYEIIKDGTSEGGMPSGFIVDKSQSVFGKIKLYINGKEPKKNLRQF